MISMGITLMTIIIFVLSVMFLVIDVMVLLLQDVYKLGALMVTIMMELNVKFVISNVCFVLEEVIMNAKNVM